MESMDRYSEGLDGVVEEHKSFLGTTTVEARFLAQFHSSKLALTFDDLAGMLAVAIERLSHS